MVFNLLIVFGAITLLIILTLIFYFTLPKTKWWYNNVTKFEELTKNFKNIKGLINKGEFKD